MFNTEFMINKTKIGNEHPSYFIADISANHDGELNRAKDLIYMVAEAGGNAAKFQHFTASTIVSDKGFKTLGNQQSHQASWNKSVYDVYDNASVNISWTSILKETCEKAGIDFLTSPYSIELVDLVDQFVPAYKIGSGDITWPEIIEYMSQKGKPILLATGASTLDDVHRAVKAIEKHNNNLVLMQCNTNYTASVENYKYINLNVLKTYRDIYPSIVLGLSDHTSGHVTVLGSIALGARVIEKHFTDSNERIGPDHKFSMTPKSWKEMVERSRELESSLGVGIKKIEDNEKETVILQRRSIRTKIDLTKDTILCPENIEVLRPCPEDAITPIHLDDIFGKALNKNIAKGTNIKWNDLA